MTVVDVDVVDVVVLLWLDELWGCLVVVVIVVVVWGVVEDGVDEDWTVLVTGCGDCDDVSIEGSGVVVDVVVVVTVVVDGCFVVDEPWGLTVNSE